VTKANAIDAAPLSLTRGINSTPPRADARRPDARRVGRADADAGLCCRFSGAGARSKRYDARTESAGKYPPPNTRPHVAQNRASDLRARVPHAGHAGDSWPREASRAPSVLSLSPERAFICFAGEA
jgi:hypothetical protein